MSKESEKTTSTDKESKEVPKNLSQALIRLVWPSRFRVLYLIGIAIIVGVFSFWQTLPTGLILSPFFSEKIRLEKYNSQFNNSAKLIQSKDTEKQIKGISLLQELAISYPYKRQELANYLQEFLMESFPQDKKVEIKYLPVLVHGIRTITAIPRYDDNGHPLNIELNQIRIEETEGTKGFLKNTNFKDTSLWGCQFYNVIFSRSNFENANLGGTVFDNCSLEHANLKGAKLECSPMDEGRPTSFLQTLLWGTNLHEADIGYCEIKLHDDEALGKDWLAQWKSKMDRWLSNGKVKLIN